jgi:hypothetical protein
MMSFSASTTALPGKLAVTALLSILLISSCSDPASVGLELAPGNNQIGVFYKEFELEAQMVLLDSLNTTNSSVLLAGHETDDFFGTTEAIGYSRMFMNLNVTRPRNDAILDSAFFHLDIVSVNGSDLDEPKTYSVHQLAEPILDTIYYNSDHLEYFENPISEGEIVFDDVKDTTVMFPLESTFSDEMFVKIRSTREFQSLFEFRDFFPGFAVKARAGDNTTVGIAPGENTKMTFYYHYQGDTTSTSYSINTLSARRFYGINSDRSGTPTEIITEYDKSYDVGPTVGLKSGLAMTIRLDTSPIGTFLDSLSGVTFNQANLQIGPIQDQKEGNNPISGMWMILIDRNNVPIRSTINGSPLYVQRDGQPQVIPDANGDNVPSNSRAAGSLAEIRYGVEEKDYSTGVTSHVNSIFRGQLQRQDWRLLAFEFTQSLQQFKVDKNTVKVQVIYSKSR